MAAPHRWLRILGLSATIAGCAAPAVADPPAREWRETLGAAINLPGIQNSLEVSWRWPLTRSSHPLLRDAHWALGLAHTVAPSNTRLGAWIEIAPLSLLELRAGIEPALYHGVAGSLLGFSSRDEIYDQDRRRELGSRAAVELGGRAFLAPTLRLRFQRLVATAGAELEWWRSNAAEPFFYEPGRDTLLESRGDRIVRTSLVLAHETRGPAGRRLLAGVNHRTTQVPGVPGAKIERPGILAAWTVGDRRFGVREPTLLVNVFYYRADPYKKGEPGLTLGVRLLLGR